MLPTAPTAPAGPVAANPLLPTADSGLSLAQPAPLSAPPPVAPTFSSPAPMFEPPPPPPAPAPVVDVPPPAAPAPVETPTSYVAGPAMGAGPAAVAPPAGLLPTYGSDIRPPIAAVPPVAPPPIVAAGPAPGAAASAPVNPASGVGGIGQPVVRQTTPTPTAPAEPTGLGTQMVTATAGGAVAGAASEQVTAQGRLQRLIDMVARQEPRLRWAVADRPDGTTVLVTDLASGWIPPQIAIPAAMTLLEPAVRRGDIHALLGEATVVAHYSPVHALPDADDAEPIPTSTRVRQGPVIEELGWELGQATKWRDGLPRLAHTIAKAAAAGTGVLDSEIDLLRETLTDVRELVLTAYPDTIDTITLGNWQLLAAIDALAETDTTGARYHFAWFRALDRGQ